MRLPELHPNPEVMRFDGGTCLFAKVELGQHTDGRWMWAMSFFTAKHGAGYACGPKWGNFAEDRITALDSAIAELRERAGPGEIADWAESLNPRQASLFG